MKGHITLEFVLLRKAGTLNLAVNLLVELKR
jgi:hypothetical protein